MIKYIEKNSEVSIKTIAYYFYNFAFHCFNQKYRYQTDGEWSKTIKIIIFTRNNQEWIQKLSSKIHKWIPRWIRSKYDH